MKINLTIKRVDSWNTVNRTQIFKVIENSIIKCDGHYTDDYAHDAERNYQNDLTSDQCKEKLLSDLKDDSYKYVKLYWDNKNKAFIIYYGQWLSYTATPTESLKLNFIEPEPYNKTIPQEVITLKEKVQETTNLYFKKNGFVNIQPDIVTIKPRSKYYALDVGSSGKFLIDKITLTVYSIKAYGQKGYCQGTIQDVIERYEQDITTFKRLLNGEVKGVYALNY